MCVVNKTGCHTSLSQQNNFIHLMQKEYRSGVPRNRWDLFLYGDYLHNNEGIDLGPNVNWIVTSPVSWKCATLLSNKNFFWSLGHRSISPLYILTDFRIYNFASVLIHKHIVGFGIYMYKILLLLLLVWRVLFQLSWFKRPNWSKSLDWLS